MEDLINALLRNPFLILLLLGGLFSLFSNKEKNKEQENEKVGPPPTTQKERKPIRERNVTRERHDPVQQPVKTASIEEQREKQLQRITDQLIRVGESTEEDIRTLKQHKSTPINNQTKSPNNASSSSFKRQFKENLTKEGIVQGIVMAEVLGPPRAKKPYQKYTRKRQNQ